MKKILCLTLLTVLVLSSMIATIACGEKTQEPTPPSTPGTTPTQPETTPAPGSQPAANPNEVVITDKGFSPATITIAAGEKVTWYNKDIRRWWVSSETKIPDTGVIPTGQRMSYTFKEPGEYDYYDLYHRDQTGKVIVK